MLSDIAGYKDSSEIILDICEEGDLCTASGKTFCVLKREGNRLTLVDYNKNKTCSRDEIPETLSTYKNSLDTREMGSVSDIRLISLSELKGFCGNEKMQNRAAEMFDTSALWCEEGAASFSEHGFSFQGDRVWIKDNVKYAIPVFIIEMS